MMRSAQGKASKTISCRPVKSGGSAMQASNTPPHHPPGVAFPTWNPAGKVERKSNRFESRMNFSASGIPGGAFFMHFCAFVPLPEFNTRCSVNSMFAKLVFSEICTQKAHFARLWAFPGIIRRAGRCCGQGAPFCIPLPKSSGFQSRTKVEPKSKRSQSRRGIPCLKVE